MSRGVLLDVFSLESIAAHSHAIALFVLYVFIRFYRSFSGPTVAKAANSKRKSSVASSKKRDSAKSSMPRTSSSTQLEEIQHYDDDATVIAFLENSLSLELKSTVTERRRFLVAEKGNVKATKDRLNFYLQWNDEHVRTRSQNDIKMKPTRDRDYDVWVESCLTAMKENGEVENIVLPRIIRQLCRENCRGALDDSNHHNTRTALRDRDGSRVFCIRPALMDIRLAKAATYTLAVAIYLDRSIDRQFGEKVTVVVDVRAGQGWPNTHVLKLIPFVKHSVQLLLPLFPERLHRALVYPVPNAFYYIWTMISKCMDPLTVERVCILSGKCKIEAPPPNEKLTKYFDDKSLERLEAMRVNNFR
mmetsp:Transcript_6378/g.15480  ORF Transcript_6378/g.15480 Transcript_6378/m.15480 type:complete len:360 (+) Transcript_6378:176-1255(+)